MSCWCEHWYAIILIQTVQPQVAIYVLFNSGSSNHSEFQTIRFITRSLDSLNSTSAIFAWRKWRIWYYGGAVREFKLLLGSRSHSSHIPLWHNQVLSPSCQSQCTPELFIRLYFIYVCISPMPPEKVRGSWALWQPWLRSRRLSSLKQTLGGCRGSTWAAHTRTVSNYPCTFSKRFPSVSRCKTLMLDVW